MLFCFQARPSNKLLNISRCVYLCVHSVCILFVNTASPPRFQSHTHLEVEPDQAWPDHSERLTLLSNSNPKFPISWHPRWERNQFTLTRVTRSCDQMCEWFGGWYDVTWLCFWDTQSVIIFRCSFEAEYVMSDNGWILVHKNLEWKWPDSWHKLNYSPPNAHKKRTALSLW